MKLFFSIVGSVLLLASSRSQGQRYVDSSGRLRIALAMQPFSPTGTSRGPKYDGDRWHSGHAETARRDDTRGRGAPDSG
jgi:hypothetical protein